MLWCKYIFSAILCLGPITPPDSTNLLERADELWNESAVAMGSHQLDDARLGATKSRELAMESRDTWRTFKANALLALIDERSGDVSSAVKSLLSMRDKAHADNDFKVEFRCLDMLGELAIRQGALSESATFYSSAEELVLHKGTRKDLAAVYLDLVKVYQAMGAPKRAEEAASDLSEVCRTLPESDRTKYQTDLGVISLSISQADLVAASARAGTDYERGLFRVAMARLHLRSGHIQKSTAAFELGFSDVPLLHAPNNAYYYATALVQAERRDKARAILDQLSEGLATPSELRGRVLALQTYLAESELQYAKKTQEALEHTRALNLMRGEFEVAITDYRQQAAKREEKRRVALAEENARYKIYVRLGWASIGLAILATLVVARYQGKRRVAVLNMNRARERVAERRERAVAIGNLASGVAHDFNNLMTVIYSVSETVHNVAAERLTPKETEMLGEVLRATESGIEITRQLLALSRGSGDEGDFLVGKHVVGIRGLLVRTLGEGIELDIQTGDANAIIMASKAQLTSALINLCANARDAIGQGGQVTITVESDRRESGRYVQISVQDNGCGMSSKQVLHATDQHFTTKTPDRGTGLGLSMVDRFVSEANGQLVITSQLGRGTRVSMELPCRDTNHGARHSMIQGMCILCVDPVVSVTNTVKETLQRLGCEVHTAMNVDSAYELLDQISPDVVLLSVNALRDQRVGSLDRMSKNYKHMTVVVTAPVTYESEYSPILRVPFTEDELRDAIVEATEPAELPDRFA